MNRKKIRKESNVYDGRTNIGISIMRDDYDLFKEKCYAMEMSQSEVLRQLISFFNDTTIILVKDK